MQLLKREIEQSCLIDHIYLEKSGHYALLDEVQIIGKKFCSKKSRSQNIREIRKFGQYRIQLSVTLATIYIYIYMCVCVCVCVCAQLWDETHGQF